MHNMHNVNDVNTHIHIYIYVYIYSFVAVFADVFGAAFPWIFVFSLSCEACEQSISHHTDALSEALAVDSEGQWQDETTPLDWPS